MDLDGLMYANRSLLQWCSQRWEQQSTFNMYLRPPPVILINLDDSGRPLSGANNYKIHFTQIPPPHWTLTSLDKDNTPYNRTVWLSSVKKSCSRLTVNITQFYTRLAKIERNGLWKKKESTTIMVKEIYHAFRIEKKSLESLTVDSLNK